MLGVVIPIVMQLAAPIALATAPRAGVGDSTTVIVLARMPDVADTTPRRRPHAIEYSDWYARRLTIHKIGAFVSLPLYPAEYILGDRLLNGRNVESWVKPAHGVVAGAIAGVFGINTITGLWNLYDSRHDEAGRTRRIVHSVLMLSSDAGFAATGIAAGQANETLSGAHLHRNLAIGSMAVGLTGTVLMWLWKD